MALTDEDYGRALEAAAQAMLASSAGITYVSAMKMWNDLSEESRTSLRNTVAPVLGAGLNALFAKED